MIIDNKKQFIINVVYFSLILIIGYLIAKYVIGVMFPFVLGFVIAMALKPLIRWTHKKLNLNNTVVSLIILLLFYSLIGGGLFLLIVKLFTLLKGLFEDIPKMFQSDIQPLINQFTAWATDLFYKINPDIIDFIQQFDENILEQLGGIVSNFSTGAVNILTGMVTKLPSFFLSFLLTIVSSFFITIDYDKIVGFFNYQITEKNKRLFVAIKRNGIDVAVNFFKAYGILLTVTFIESAIGLSLLGINNAIGISLIIAAVDILPVLGTGTVMVPWAIIEFFNGNIGDAIGLAVLYAIITVIRQILEPRVVGDSIGLYPLVTLISMYLGVKYFGAIGLLGLPMVVTVVVKLHEEGIVRIWRDPNQIESMEVETDV